VVRTYPVWDTDAEKLIAFLFGIISHQDRPFLTLKKEHFFKPIK
jgi:hypothetical protein